MSKIFDFSVRTALVILCLSTCSVVFGQETDHEIHIGVKAGVSIPNLVGGSTQEITRDYKSRVASTYGGFVDLGINKHASIQLEIDYAMQGGRRNGVQPITAPIPGLPPLPPGTYFFADFKNTAKLNYVEFPVMLKYSWRKREKPGIYVNGGPYFGYLVKATQVTRGSSTIYLDKNKTPLLLPPLGQPLPPMPFDADTNVTSSLHRYNIGITGGGGLTFPAGKGSVFLDARVAYGLTTLQKNTLTDGSSRTGNLVISLGYAFRVKGK
jgi:hypothetical protein